MLGWLGKVMGTDKALSKTIEVVSNGLDSLIHTDQEIAEEAIHERGEARKMIIQWMESTQGQNLARRFIAIVIVMAWLGQYIIAMFLSVISVWADKPQQFLDSAEIIGQYAQGMNNAVMLILAFYFAAPHMGKVVETVLAGFGKGPVQPKPGLKHE